MLNGIDHVGIVVDDLAEAKKFLGEVLGLPLRREFAVPDRKLEVAFFGLGNAEIELLKVGDPEEERRRLGVGVAARIDHIAFGVDDVAAAAGELQSRGVEMQTPTPRTSAWNTNIFTRADSSDGVTYQLIKWLNR